jgi:hypothetical protein
VFIKLLILSVVLITLALVGLGISMLIKPGGKFPDTHISHNKEMRKRGITCAQHTDTGCKPVEGVSGCAGCGYSAD